MDAFLMSQSSDELRRLNCLPVPSAWIAFGQKYKLSWTAVPFGPTTSAGVPTVPGFYCFFVGYPPGGLPPVGYPLYVGKTERTLRRRFGEYLREKNSPSGRGRVRKFLKVFEDEIMFLFAPFHGTAKQVKEIETALHDALRPPYSDVGFSAEVRQKRQAFQ